MGTVLLVSLMFSLLSSGVSSTLNLLTISLICSTSSLSWSNFDSLTVSFDCTCNSSFAYASLKSLSFCWCLPISSYFSWERSCAFRSPEIYINFSLSVFRVVTCLSNEDSLQLYKTEAELLLVKHDNFIFLLYHLDFAFIDFTLLFLHQFEHLSIYFGFSALLLQILLL